MSLQTEQLYEPKLLGISKETLHQPYLTTDYSLIY